MNANKMKLDFSDEAQLDMCQLYKLILDLMVDQVTVADGNGIFQFINKSCEEYFGVKEEDIIHRSGFEMESAGVFDTSATAEVVRTNRKVRLIQKTGAGKILLVTGYPIYDKKGERIRIINISTDITEKEMLKSELEESLNMLEWYKRERRLREVKMEKNITTKSPRMIQVHETLKQIADTDILIMLLGKTGVGKSFMAKYIHHISKRSEESFFTVNCGAIPENLLESELFGYEKGAFTGALSKGKTGIFELAGRGTILLDEIGDLPLGLQVKLLYAIEARKFIKIGGNKETNFEARLLVATNKDLKAMVEQGRFREDLYYRLNLLPIEIPSLSERKEDLPDIIKHMEEDINEKYKTEKTFDESAYGILLDYDYPGNIRELRNILERAIITSPQDKIGAGHITSFLKKDGDKILIQDLNEIMPMRAAVEELEKRLLILAQEKYGTTRRMADALEMDQSTIVKKQKRYFG